MTTNILLTLIVVLLAVRIVLQVRQGKRSYYTTRAVKRVVVDGNSIEDLRDKLCEKWWWSDYEIVSVIEAYFTPFSNQRIFITIKRTDMAYLCVDKDGTELVCSDKPSREPYMDDGYQTDSVWCSDEQVELPKGSIAKLIGRELTWEDEPYKLE